MKWLIFCLTEGLLWYLTMYVSTTRQLCIVTCSANRSSYMRGQYWIKNLPRIDRVMCVGRLFKNGPRTHPEPWTYLPLPPYNTWFKRLKNYKVLSNSTRLSLRLKTLRVLCPSPVTRSSSVLELWVLLISTRLSLRLKTLWVLCPSLVTHDDALLYCLCGWLYRMSRHVCIHL